MSHLSYDRDKAVVFCLRASVNTCAVDGHTETNSNASFFLDCFTILKINKIIFKITGTLNKSLAFVCRLSTSAFFLCSSPDQNYLPSSARLRKKGQIHFFLPIPCFFPAGWSGTRVMPEPWWALKRSGSKIFWLTKKKKKRKEEAAEKRKHSMRHAAVRVILLIIFGNSAPLMDFRLFFHALIWMALHAE